MSVASPACWRFGPFHVDVETGEVLQGGRKFRLQEKPLRMLRALLERPGHIVTRDELRQRLWPADVFVDFDHGLHNAANKLRQALGDPAGTPKYIETVGRRGYRYVGPMPEFLPQSGTL